MVERCRPLLDAIGRQTFVVGTEPWQANIAMLCGNFMIASTIEAFGEASATLRKAEVAPETAGDPMSLQKWTRSSLRRLSQRLRARGHRASPPTVGLLLKKHKYALRVNRKTQESGQDEGADAEHTSGGRGGRLATKLRHRPCFLQRGGELFVRAGALHRLRPHQGARSGRRGSHATRGGGALAIPRQAAARAGAAGPPRRPCHLHRADAASSGALRRVRAAVSEPGGAPPRPP